jgi:hypothetical protein
MTMSLTINVSKFNMGAFLTNVSVALITGRYRGSGKTHLLKEFVHNLKEQGVTRFVTFTPIVNDWKSDVLPPTLENLNKVWHEQKELCKDNKSSHLVIILDSCGHKKEIMNSEVLCDILHIARYFHTTLLMSSTYSGDLSPALQNRVDATFILGTIGNDSEIEKIRRTLFYQVTTVEHMRQIHKANDPLNDHTSLGVACRRAVLLQGSRCRHLSA